MKNHIANTKIGLMRMIPLALDSLSDLAQIVSLNKPLMFEKLQDAIMATKENKAPDGCGKPAEI